MPRPPMPYLHRGHYVSNVGGKRHRLCPREAGKPAAWAAVRAILAEGPAPAAHAPAPSASPASPPLGVAQLAEKYVRHKEGKIDAKNLAKQAAWLRRFVERHPGRQAKDITPLLAEEYIDGIARSTWVTTGGGRRPYSPKTVNHILATLRQTFGWAIDRDLLPMKNPWARVRPLACVGRQRVMTDAEWLSLMRNAQPCFRRVLLVLRFTSMRPGELRGLAWSDVDWANSRVVLHDHKTMKKTGKPRIIPFPPCVGRLLRWLQDRQDGGPDSLAFLNSWGRPWTAKHLPAYMAAVRQRAGLAPDRRGEEITLYSHRHRYLTEAASSRGIDGPLLMRLAGHTNLGMTTRYAHLSAGTLGHAAALVAESLRPQRAKEAEARRAAAA